MRFSGIPGIIGNAGWERASACTWLFSSTHNTTAASGGFRYSPTTSKTFSTNNGSVDSLNVSARCGLSSNARQIRPIVDLRQARCAWPSSPATSASRSAGVDSNVATTTSSTCSAVIVAGRPGRGSSTSPSNRSSQNRDRHFPTVAADTPSAAATSLLDTPAAQANTIRERNANAWDDFRRRAHRTSCSRSSSVNSNTAFGRPVRGIPKHTIIITRT